MENGKRDYCNKPFKVAVALGESTTAGGTATSRELTWVSRLAELINESQLEPIQMVNSGIGGNVISSRSPSYEESGKPSAMERAEQVEREVELRPQEEPKVNAAGIEETVADKGYHSGAVIQRLKGYGVRSYIPEKKQKGQRHWKGKQAEQQAVYANRRRVRCEYGKSLLRRRGELVERSFAHCYETGGMRRCHLRGHKNILKRQLIHVGAFNLSLILRKLLGAGTPRELNNRAGQVFSRLFFFLLTLREVIWRIWSHPPAAGSRTKPWRPRSTSDHRPRVFNASATGC